MKGELIRALEAISADPNELAYLALTSKPEFQVRDRLAYRLHQALLKQDSDLHVAREWKRVDLAVLDHGEPLALIEAKAMTSYNVTRDDHRARYQASVRADLAAARARASAADVYALLMVTHLRGEVPAELHGVVKYATRMLPVTTEELDHELENFLPEVGRPSRLALGEGRAFGLAVEVITWLFGPVNTNGEEVLVGGE